LLFFISIRHEVSNSLAQFDHFNLCNKTCFLESALSCGIRSGWSF
uniref:DUF3265 domain-containing protein n=1 Tax=Haemonchus placei TaxID=6290 RepID=A0A0N4W2V1_HAEPC